MWNSEVMVAMAPGASVPRVHGNAVRQAPVFEVNVNPDGVESSTTTPTAVEGPTLTTTVVKVMSVPAVTEPGLAVLLTCTSAEGAMGVVSVAVSSPGVGSVVPTGGVAVAVLARVPMASCATVPVAMKVADAPAGRSTVVAMAPEPLVSPQTPPSEALHVHVTPVSTAGKVSLTEAPVTVPGPALTTVIVYVSVSPAITLSTPSVFVTDRSAIRFAVTVTLPESLPGLGSGSLPAVLVAVLVKPPGCSTSAVIESDADCEAVMSPAVHTPLAAS